MKELTQFTSIRKNTSTSARLCRVLIIHWEGRSPSTDLIQRLRNYVKIVDARAGGNEVLANSDIVRYLTLGAEGVLPSRHIESFLSF